MARPARWLLLAALLAVLAFGDVPEPTRIWEAVFNLGHVPLFGAIALMVRAMLAGRASSTTPAAVSWRAFGVTVLIGGVTELLQLLQANRDASLDDFLRDAAGAGAFLLLAGPASRRGATGMARPWRTRAAALVTASCLFAAAGAELARTAALYAARDRALPTLYALDGSWWERELVDAGENVLTPNRRPTGAAVPPTARFARLDLRPGLYPGLTFEEPYPDWSGYRRLVVTAASDLETPLTLTIRVHDAAHDQRYADRFNRRLVVSPGLNRFVIPIEEIAAAPDRRRMDLRRIRGIVLFAYELDHSTHVYLGPLRLE
jgi:hypothetical protein